MSRDFPGFLRVARDFSCFTGGFEFFWARKEYPPPQTKNIEVLVISVYTAYGHGPIHQICLVFGTTIISTPVDFRALTILLRW